jgi:hypothetical protein
MLRSVIRFGRSLIARRPPPGAVPKGSVSQPRESMTLNRTDVFSLLIVIVLGVAKLPQPFLNDQALYTVTAENMRDGWLLYRDAWDVKQPGIFYFYFAGGSLFGFNEIGIHLFELIWMVVLSVILLLTLKRQFKSESLASLLPVFTVGMYFGTTGQLHQTQPETVMALPTFLSLWFSHRALKPGGRRILWLFFSGMMGGVVVVLKLMFLPIPLAFWLTALWRTMGATEKSFAAVLQSLLSIGLGVSIPLFFTMAHLSSQGILDIAIWTFFIYPSKAVTHWPFTINIGTLVDSVLWFLRNFAPVLALSMIGVYSRLGTNRDSLMLNLILWVGAAGFVILLQRLSWFQSHFMLLVIPVGILAARGLDLLCLALKRLNVGITERRSHLVAVTSAILLFSPMSIQAALTVRLFARDNFTSLLTTDGLRKHQSVESSYHAQALREVAFLKSPDAAPGEIYVVGDAIYYYLSGRDPAIPILVRYFTPPFLWAKLLSALYRAPRPAYIFITKDSISQLQKHTPEAAPYIEEVARFVDKYYDVIRTSEAGTWYVLGELESRA